MLRNYLKIAWRNLLRTPGYSALNILGLGIGMAVAILIGLWVYHQFSFDKSIPDTERLYRVQRNFNANGDTLTFQTTSLRLAEELKTIPGIEYVAESDWMGGHGLMNGETKISQSGGIVGPDFLKMFRYPFVKGNAEAAFNDAYSIVLSESTAKALFGNDEPMGRMIRFDNAHNLRVTGVMKDLPANSSFNFKYLVPYTFLDQTNPYIKENRAGSYGANNLQIFVKMKEGVSYSSIASRLRTIEHTEKNSTNAMNSFVTLQAMDRWHLYSNYINGKDTAGFLQYVKMFAIIGLLVLIIACINFINLTTAKSERRAREVGVRKVIGSLRKDLIVQFLTESFLQTSFAFIVAVILVGVVLEPFNQLAESAIQLPLTNISFWLLLVGGVVITSVLAGSRPAFVLSSFKPIKVLKGATKIAGGALPRKAMFVFQFSASIALIISTFIIYQQLQHAKNRSTGLNLSGLITTWMSEDLSKNYTALKNEILQKGLVTSVTTASSPATNVYWHTDLDNFPGKQGNETVEMGVIMVDEDYFKTLGMNMTEGREFTSVNDTTAIMFNQAGIERLRLKNPLSQKIEWDGRTRVITGVVKDALMLSPFAAADPTLFIVNNVPNSVMMYRLNTSKNKEQAFAELTTIFNKYNPAFPYEYNFEDQAHANKFKTEALIGRLSGIFASLAIFISCLGLFGLSAYVAASKTKEIGIRKVLGASVGQVWVLLSRDFIALVILSCIIASPIAYYFLHGWLGKYEYRISIGPLVFIAASVLSIMIAILTMSFEGIRAALANPVKSIKAE
ncbi:MAG: ABC transporter permease [Flavitalea sp.]